MEFSHNLLKEMNQQDKEHVQLPFILDWKWILGLILEFVKIGWCFLFAEDHRRKWAKFFCFIAFDPGGTLSLSKWLLPGFHTIHNLEAVSIGFDPGKLILHYMEGLMQ